MTVQIVRTVLWRRVKMEVTGTVEECRVMKIQTAWWTPVVVVEVEVDLEVEAEGVEGGEEEQVE